jgi:hypothetical protein
LPFRDNPLIGIRVRRMRLVRGYVFGSPGRSYGRQVPERRPAPSAPSRQPPTTLGPHLRSALRELLTQPVRGWRLGALVVILAVAIAGGAGLAQAVGIEDDWAVLAVQAVLVAVLIVVAAVVVAVGRARRGRRLAAAAPARRPGDPGRR